MESPFKNTNEIFETKRPFEEDFRPDQILERETEIEEYGTALQDILDGFGPPNVFVYGQTGVGKTATTQKVLEFLESECAETTVDLTVFTLNCNKRNTTYKVISKLANDLHPDRQFKQGTHPDTLWSVIYSRLDEIGGDVLVVLDEIDKLGGDEELLYEFPRANAMGELDNARVGIIGISNDFKFRENLSQRVKSTLTEKEIQFKPYNATQLRSILGYYADLTFYEGVLSDDVVPLCAALTAQDTGDARMGLDLLETAGDIARHEEADAVRDEHVQLARTQVDRANTERIIYNRLTVQMRAVLVALTLTVLDPDIQSKVKEIYPMYKTVCQRVDVDVLSESRVRDHLNTLDMFGLIEAREQNLGRSGGRAYIYELVDETVIVVETLREMDRWERAFPSRTDALLDRITTGETSSIQRDLSF
jgi:cell division control protein 6